MLENYNMILHNISESMPNIKKWLKYFQFYFQKQAYTVLHIIAPPTIDEVQFMSYSAQTVALTEILFSNLI